MEFNMWFFRFQRVPPLRNLRSQNFDPNFLSDLWVCRYNIAHFFILWPKVPDGISPDPNRDTHLERFPCKNKLRCLQIICFQNRWYDVTENNKKLRFIEGIKVNEKIFTDKIYIKYLPVRTIAFCTTYICIVMDPI